MEKTFKNEKNNTHTPNKMGVQPMGSLLFGMAVPLVISMLVQALYNVVDSYFVSKLGDAMIRAGNIVADSTGKPINVPLTAVSLANPIQMLIIAVSVGTAVGMNSYISRKLGAAEHDRANNGAENGMFLLFLSSLIFVVLGFFTRPFFAMFTDKPEVIDHGASYLRVCMWFSTGVFMQIGGDRILQSMGKNNLAMLTQLIGAVTNIILDPILIFGLGPIPAFGIAGAAYATVIGQWMAFIMSIILILGKDHEVTLSFKAFKPSGKTIAEIYRVGVPSILLQAIGSVMIVGMNSIFTRVLADDSGVAILGVYFKVQSLIFMPLFGLTNASMSIIAYNYGAKNRLRLTKAWKLTMITAMTIMLVGTLAFQIFPAQIIRVFDASGTISSGGTAAFRIISLSFIIAAVSISNSITFGALGRGSASMVMSIIRQLGILLPASYILAITFKTIESVWWSFLIAELVAFTFGLIMLKRIWKSDVSNLPDGVNA